jgi:hypothetical protein
LLEGFVSIVGRSENSREFGEWRRVRRRLRAPPRSPACVEFSCRRAKGSETAGFLNDRFVSETVDLWFGRRIGAFFSTLKIPFPGNGDRHRRRPGSNGELVRRQSEHLVLVGPFNRQVGEADNSHAMREPSFDRRLDEIVDHQVRDGARFCATTRRTSPPWTYLLSRPLASTCSMR